ncbi:MAG: dihydropteroate synthase [Candidatus Brocadiia bacterium]
MTARLPHNPRVLAAPGNAALHAEVAALGGQPPCGEWFVKLDRLPAEQAEALRRTAEEHAGALVRPPASGPAQAILRVPAERLGACLDALAPRSLADAVRATIDAWRRERFTLGCGGQALELGRRTLVMGIVNVTPDSFSDGGAFLDPAAAIEHGRRLAEEGADILDIGGESTRPGAQAVDAETECQRVLPVVQALARELDLPISIDTSKASVAARALGAGASMLNDVTALRGDPQMADLAARSGAPLVLMHMQGTPRSMQEAPHYDDLMGEILAYLRQGMAMALDAGVGEEQVAVDPGIGFGKTVGHNLEILRRLAELRSLGCPILLGTSRKSVIGAVLGLPLERRLLGTAATVAYGIARGAHVVRVHDVAAMRQVARMSDAMVGREWAEGE